VQEFIIVLLIIGFFAVLAPLSGSKKRAVTQKLLTEKLISEKFATAAVLPMGEMSLYTDEVHGKFFIRMSRIDTSPVIYPFSALSAFELMDSGNVTVSASAGHLPSGDVFGHGKYGELLDKDDCSSLMLILKPGNDRSLQINVPLLSSPVPRFSHSYRAAFSQAKDAVNALLKIMSAEQGEKVV
jgi:hypothetical protein